MTIIFDGKAFAKQKEEKLGKKVKALLDKKITPKLATILFAGDDSAQLYVGLKEKAAKRMGIEVERYSISERKGADHIIRLIKAFNNDNEIHGIMIQLPFPERYRPYERKILNSIIASKDVDGLSDNGHYVAATVKAVFAIFPQAQVSKRDEILVIGSKGEIGKRLVQFLSHQGYAVEGVDKEVLDLQQKASKADVIISATGREGLIKADMVKQNAVVIDVGAPFGDLDPTAAVKTMFYTPVPGGVGPVTIISLFENLVEAVTRVAKEL